MKKIALIASAGLFLFPLLAFGSAALGPSKACSTSTASWVGATYDHGLKYDVITCGTPMSGKSYAGCPDTKKGAKWQPYALGYMCRATEGKPCYYKPISGGYPSSDQCNMGS